MDAWGVFTLGTIVFMLVWILVATIRNGHGFEETMPEESDPPKSVDTILLLADHELEKAHKLLANKEVKE